MDKIMEILEGIDISGILPDLDALTENLQLIARICLLIGPVVLLFLGFIYLLVPPKEANHKAGFRTYFGMGSIEAWQFTQRLAGIVLGTLGLILGIVMWSITRDFAGMEVGALVDKAALCLIWQGGLVLFSYFGISVTAAVMFDRNGNNRWKKSKN